MKLSQSEIVLQHLQSNGSLGWIEASQKYGVTRLCNCILALKKKGHNITSKIIMTELFGEPIEEVVYCLEEEKL